jgi:hypothetical protein
VLLEAGPGEADPSDKIATWLASWPIPFASRAVAADFLGGGPVGDAWAGGLGANAEGGLTWRFDPDIIVATIAAHAGRPYWTQWQAITVPTLAVLAANGYISEDEEREMRHRRPARIVRLPRLGRSHLESEAGATSLCRGSIGGMSMSPLGWGHG